MKFIDWQILFTHSIVGHLNGIRNVALWADLLKKDICNMDETPLALFGDQSHRSINDIGTTNEINGHISNKVMIISIENNFIVEVSIIFLFRDFVH